MVSLNSVSEWSVFIRLSWILVNFGELVIDWSGSCIDSDMLVMLTLIKM